MVSREKIGEIYEPKGTLIIIGGHEQREPEKDCQILSEVAKRVNGGKLVVVTLASEEPTELWEEYLRVFNKLKVSSIEHLHFTTREEALLPQTRKILDGASGVFFTGGDQLRLTSLIGGSELCEKVQEIYARGGVVAGTSAGASAMSETMIVGGASHHTMRGQKLRMAPGLGYVKEFVIDQHFAERGRISRLICAVALNPKYIGLGIDEDTAVILDQPDSFGVIGSGSVYVVDGEAATYTNISEQEDDDESLAVHGCRISLLNCGQRFEILNRQPKPQ